MTISCAGSAVAKRRQSSAARGRFMQRYSAIPRRRQLSFRAPQAFHVVERNLQQLSESLLVRVGDEQMPVVLDGVRILERRGVGRREIKPREAGESQAVVRYGQVHLATADGVRDEHAIAAARA